MNNFINDSGRSSQLSNAYSDNESPSSQLSSRTSNHDKYMTYHKPKKESRFIYNNIRKPFIRPSSRSNIQSRMMDHISTVGGGRDPDGFVRRKKDEECLKCMLKIPHKKCESHKYIRVGGGYRHSYYYVRMLLEQIELKKQRDELLRRRLEAISEGNMRALKTYIRTKSGRIIEKIIYVSDEDFIAFNESLARGEDPTKVLQKYLSKDEFNNLDSYDKDENVALKTYVRTKSGRLVEKIIYISKKDFDAIQRGDLDSNALLRKKLGLKSGEKLEGWAESKMRTITTKIRTKSGRIIEKQIMISEEDYQKLQKGGNVNDIISKYMKNDPDVEILNWKKTPKAPMKVVKTFIRTKSGRLIEKTILMTEKEYQEFLDSKEDPNFLKEYLNLKENEIIEGWEKSSTVYEGSDNEERVKAKVGQILKDKDGNEYEVIVDPLTGKKYKKLIKKADDALVYRTADGRIITKKDIEKRKNYKEGKRDPKSDSEYSYKSFISAGGTRHVHRKKKNAGNTRGDSESYHSSQDEDGKARRRNRRRKLKHGPNSAHSYQSVVSAGGTRHVRRRKKHADGTYSDSESYHSADSAMFKEAEKTIKEQKKLLRNKTGIDSDDSYFSEVSEGGTRRKMKRKRIKNELGAGVGYGSKVEVDSTGKPIGDKNGKKRRKHDSDSDFSYFSDVSAGGTHYQKRKEKIRDKNGKVIGYKKPEDYSSDSESSFITVSDGKGGKIKVANPNKKKRRISKVFSDATTDSDIVNEIMKNMTEEEKKKYLADRAERAKEREQNRKEKYGDKYEKMKKLHDKIKKLEKQEKFQAIFSDATTDSDVVQERMKNMTEEEKIKYLAEREQRAVEREQKRKEKYGEKYEEMKKEYEKKKEVFKEKLEKAKKEATERKLARDKKNTNFNEDDADIDSDGENITGKKKKNIRKGSDASLLEVIRDKDGNIIKRIKKDKNGNITEIEYDKDGNVISTKVKKKGGKNSEDEDNGDYFEIGPDGKIRLKPGKTKIDLKNISKEDLLKLGIDPNLSKAEQLRLLKEMFGDNIDVVYNKKKIGTKNAEDMGSDAHTTDLAENSDVDIDTVKPEQRVKIIEKRYGQQLKDHAKLVLEKSNLQQFQSTDEKNSKINFLSTYRLVDPNNLEKYARFFAIEDHDDMDGIINYKACRTALGNLKRTQVINNLTEKQTDFILMALDINKHTEITFRMFSVIAALGDRMTKLDSYCRDLLEISDLLDIERKLKFYRDLFNMNELSDHDPNYIKLESISIDLKAGGLNDDQQEFVLSKLRPNEILEISFLDFLSYIPLFISYHDNILNNPLDSSNNKYSSHTKRRASIQRDMNPLGFSLSRNTQFYTKNYAVPLQSSRNIPHTDDINGLQIMGKAKEKMSKYSVLPKIHSPI